MVKDTGKDDPDAGDVWLGNRGGRWDAGAARCTSASKQQALAQLDYQLTYSAQVQRARLGDAVLSHILPHYAAIKDDDHALGLALNRAMDLALAMQYGLLNHHAHAALAEAFRHEGPFTLSRLV